MNSQQARELVSETFPQTFDKGRFREFTINLLNKIDETKAQAWNTTYIKDAFKDHVEKFERLGTYTSPDDEKLDVLIVHLTKESKLERARTAIRNFVADHLKQREGKDAALAAFLSPSEKNWRFSYIKMEYAAVEKDDGKVGVQTKLTPARRSSYIVGEDESCHTAQSRFLDLLQDTENLPTLAQIEDTFSVEAVTKEFFEQYKALFLDLKDELDDIAKQDKTIREEFAEKKVSTADFAKKLMGQIVFLYFLQKKGWLGVAKGSDWGDGTHNFLRQLYNKKFGGYENFFNDILEPLFYDTLATDRGHEALCSIFKCRIPFLNGGLFEPLHDYDWKKTDITIPNTLFSNSKFTKAGDKGTGILDVFDRYNFTVNEAEPLEKEVAIDPEMLGKVFENLLEVKERKSKGSFYTPREVVHYMCQESLINYLDTAINSKAELVGMERRKQGLLGDEKAEQTLLTVPARSELIPRTDIEIFVHLGDQISHYEAVDTKYVGREMPKKIKEHAKLLDENLAGIAVCDPAIGSGAFPVGMMQEIVRARSALTPYFNDSHERTAYHFKRHAIQNCIYGVDIDPGAVEIAKLRLWLSLVVDEEDVKQIKPLPNLDYKIVSGNSLLRVDKNELENWQAFRRLEELKPKFFDEVHGGKKHQIKQDIDGLIHQLTNGKENFDFEIYFSEVMDRRRKGGFDVVIGNPPYIQLQNEQGTLATKYQDSGFETFARMGDIYALFYERGRQLLRDGGHLCYITSNKWMRAGYGEKLRAFLATKTQPKILIDFAGQKIFESATVDTNILLFERKIVTSASPTLACIAAEGCRENMSVFVKQHATGQSFKGSDSWVILSPIENNIKEKVERIGMPLKNWDISINYGIKTGFNDAFIIDEAKRNEILTNCKDTAERKRTDEIIRPILRGRDIKRYGYKWAGLYLISLHNGIPEKGVPRIDPENYSAIKAHLDFYWKQIKDRFDQGDTPYNLRSCAYMDDFSEPKIVWGNLALSAQFASAPAGIFVNAPCPMIVPFNGYLLAILNSKLGDWYIRQLGVTRNGGYFEYKPMFIEQLPVPMISAKEQAIFSTLAEKATEANQRVIDEKVYTLFNLSTKEINFIQRYERFS